MMPCAEHSISIIRSRFKHKHPMSRVFLFVFYTAIAASLAWQATKTTFNNDDWLPPHHPIQKTKDYLEKEFAPGQDLSVMITLPRGLSLFDNSVLHHLGSIDERIKDLDGVQEVRSPLEATTILRTGETLQNETFAEALKKGHFKNIAAYRKEFAASVYHGRLASKNYQHILINITLKPVEQNKIFALRGRVIEAVRGIMQSNGFFKQWQFTGEGWLFQQLDEGSRDNLRLFVPLGAVVAVLFLLLIMNSFPKASLVLFSTFISMFSALALMVWQGHHLTLVGVTLPLFMMAIALADSIHIINRWDLALQQGLCASDAIKYTMRHTWLPCLMTSVTTAVGFGSFGLSELIPLSQMGQSAFGAIIASYLIVIGCNWLGLWVLKPMPSQGWQPIENVHKWASKTCHTLSMQHPGKVMLGFGLIGLVALGALVTRIHFETNFLDVFFLKNSPTYQGFSEVDRHLGGSGSLDLIFKDPQRDAYKNPKVLHALSVLQTELLQDDEVYHAISYREPVHLAFRRFTSDDASLPNNLPALAQTLLFLEFSRGAQSKDVLSPYVDFYYQNARLHLQTPNLNSTATGNIIERIQAVLQRQGHPQPLWAGLNAYFHAMSSVVLHSQVQSTSITLGVIGVLFLCVFGFRLGVLGWLSNVYIALLTGGVISLLNIPFDFASVLIIAVTFGIVVDDTIHFVHAFHGASQSSPNANVVVWSRQALNALSRPLVYTTLIFFLAFAVQLVSDFVVLLKLGSFSIFAIFSALVTDLLLVPASFRLWENVHDSRKKAHA